MIEGRVMGEGNGSEGMERGEGEMLVRVKMMGRGERMK